MSNIETDDCSDPDVILLGVKAASELCKQCSTAAVLLTSKCKQDGHGVHVTCAVLNGSGGLTPRETRALTKRLRLLADELDQRFDPKGAGN